MDSDVQKYQFDLQDDGTITLESAVYQALGSASVCWENMSGTGVFQEDRARAIAEALLEAIRNCSMYRGLGVDPLISRNDREIEDIAKVLHKSTDAKVWAETFCSLFVVKDRDPALQIDPDDVGLMIGWFANAIETAKDTITAQHVEDLIERLDDNRSEAGGRPESSFADPEV